MNKKNKSNIFCCIIAAAMVFAAPCASLAVNPENVKVVVNGSELVTDSPAVIRNGRTMVPFRAIFEALGAANVQWDNATQTVMATNGKMIIMLQIGSKDISVGGVVTTMDTPPMIINGRTMVPLSIVSKNMGASVDWDAKTYTAIVTGKDAALNPDSQTDIFGDIKPVDKPDSKSETKSTANLAGYYAMQTAKKDRYVLNLKSSGKLDIANIKDGKVYEGTYTADGNSFDIKSDIFTSKASKSEHSYKGKIMLLMKDKDSKNRVYAMTAIQEKEYNSYIK